MENINPTITPSNMSTPTQTPPPSANRGRMLRRAFLALVILLGLLTIGAVVYKYLNKSDTDKTETTNTLVTNEAQIAITKEGFTPASITVTTGTQITWTNTDTEPHQVAADPYPKNDSIPGFDSTIVLQKDESYSFTFEQAGTYTYHDELNPMTLKGTIFVE